ncbi:hypothetical protein ACLX1H_007398 [Fusarium chlamydosporum]
MASLAQTSASGPTSGGATPGSSSAVRDITPVTTEETPLLVGSESHSSLRSGTQKDSGSHQVGDAQSKVHIPFTRGIAIGLSLWLLIFLTGTDPFIPFAFATGLGIFMSIPAAAEPHDTKTPLKQKLARIDYLGAGLLTTSIVLFLYAIADEIQIVPLCLAPVILLLFLAVEVYVVADPIIPIKVLSSRGILFSCFAQLGLMIARWSVLFYAPIFMLAVRGSSPAASGSILIPTNLGFGLGGILVGLLHVRRSGAFWLPSISALTIFTISTYTLSLISTTGLSLALFLVVVLINGLATGGGVNYTLAHILHLSYDDTRYIATSLLGTFRGSGSSFGTAVAGGIFYRLLRGSLVAGFLQLDGGEQLSDDRQRLVSSLVNTPGLVHGGNLSRAEQEIAVEGYAGATRGVWQAMAALGVVVVVFQALTGKKGPGDRREAEQNDEETARAVVVENEGVGEA